MEIPPGLKKALQALGVNVTRLEWRLREWESRRERRAEDSGAEGSRAAGFRHKFCPQCGRMIDGNDKVCEHCGAAAPSLAGYRASQFWGSLLPEGAPVVTGFFIAMILANFVAAMMVDGFAGITRPAGTTLAHLGGYWPRVSEMNQWWRLFSFAFVHGGLIHLAFNTLALVQVAPMLEKELGSRRLLVVITIAQLFAGVAAFYKAVPVVGASGWLFGLIGFGISYNKRLGRRDLMHHFLNWAMYSFVFGLMVGAHNYAHFGGALGGLAAGFLFPLALGRKTSMVRVWDALVIPCAGVWGYAVAMIVVSAIKNFG